MNIITVDGGFIISIKDCLYDFKYIIMIPRMHVGIYEAILKVFNFQKKYHLKIWLIIFPYLLKHIYIKKKFTIW